MSGLLTQGPLVSYALGRTDIKKGGPQTGAAQKFCEIFSCTEPSSGSVEVLIPDHSGSDCFSGRFCSCQISSSANFFRRHSKRQWDRKPSPLPPALE